MAGLAGVRWVTDLREGPMPGRTIAIGDVHGCSTALKTLLEAIDPQPEDTIVVLGDVIDYGPDTKGCIEQLIDLSRRCQFILIEGNHEAMLFGALGGRDDLRFWLKCGGESTLASYPDREEHELIDQGHLRFLRDHCRSYHETECTFFVHAGYHPNLPMPHQPDSVLRWDFVVPSRMVPHFSGKTVVAGHTPQTNGEILDLGFLKLIDTDASRGAWLTAYEPATGLVLQANQVRSIRRRS
jgi:serine/threonine protein phosphatase 1